ncbi:hypothetical protein H7X64_02925, partial [Armatimonadetes bacterium]|nr:hypothetical protein [bacterium]
VVCLPETKGVYIKGIGGSDNPDTVNYETVALLSGTTSFQGIILTPGNVITSGEVHFNGTIIAQGDIEVNGSNNTFTNGNAATEKMLARLIRNTPKLREIFDVAAISGIPLIEYVDSTVISINSNSNIQRRYKELIDYKHWSID